MTWNKFAPTVAISSYKPNHSTETALLKVKHGILLNMSKQHVTLLVFLDLSAAFDTVHHDTLSDLGIEVDSLTWLMSYFSDRSQRVTINGEIYRHFPKASMENHKVHIWTLCTSRHTSEIVPNC